MKIIHDDFSLQTTKLQGNDPLLTYDELIEIIDRALSNPVNRVVITPQGNPLCYHVLTGGAHKVFSHGLGLSVTTGMQNVYQLKLAGGMLSQKFLVTTPVRRDAAPDFRFRTYHLDRGIGRLVNIGPVNGAITETKYTRMLNYKDPTQVFTIRVNDSKSFDPTMVTPVLFRHWECDRTQRKLNVKFTKYRETATGPEYEDFHMGLQNMGIKQELWWDTYAPGMTLDMTRPGFPLDDQDMTIAIAALFEPGP